MKKDIVYIGIVNLLKSANDENKLGEGEIETLAILINTVAKSSPHIRSYFYSGVAVIASKVKEMLDEEAAEVKNKIDKDDKGGNILN